MRKSCGGIERCPSTPLATRNQHRPSQPGRAGGFFNSPTVTYFGAIRRRCGQLIGERRFVKGVKTYDLSHAHDQLGNRRTREDDVDDALRVKCDYDVEVNDPNDLEYPTRNNRPLEYRVYGPDPSDGLGTGSQQTARLLRAIRHRLRASRRYWANGGQRG